MANDRVVGVVGAGNMGSGIAQKLAQEGFSVVLFDLGAEFLERGMNRIRTLLGEAVERRIFAQPQVDAILGRITAAKGIEDLAACGIVIEAVFEDEKVKKDLFAKLAAVVPADTILATNTSSFYVTSLAEGVPNPGRVVGLHFFYHPAKNRLVEVIPGAKTEASVIDRAMELSFSMAKTPLLCKDRPGFVVNRHFVPWLNEAVRLLEEGAADIPTIEECAKEVFQIGMGPFMLMNVTGTPIAWHAEATLGRELGSFYPPCETLIAAGKENRQWDVSGEPDRSKFDLVAARLRGVTFQVVGELMDETVCRMEDVDRGAKIALRWAVGPFEMMNALGIGKAIAEAETFCAKFGCKLSPTLAAQKAKGTPWAMRWVDTEIKDGIAMLTINRPESMNALNEDVIRDLGEAFDKVAQDPSVKGIAIEGAGKAFVAGADISFFVKRMNEGNYQRIVDFARAGQQVFRRIETCAKPVVAIADGLALGGGSEFALACHAIIATEKSRFAFPETSIGIYPGLGGTQRTARIVGPELARFLLFTGTALSGKDAVEIGFAGYFCESAKAKQFARELLGGGKVKDKFAPKEVPEKWLKIKQAFSGDGVALSPEADLADEKIAKLAKAVERNAPLALKSSAKYISEGMKMTIEAGMELELRDMAAAFATKDAFEGLTSLGVRRPVYKGE